MRTPSHKLVRRYDHGLDELFDLEADPRVTRNVIDDPTQTETVENLIEKLETFYSHHEDPERSGLRVKELPVTTPLRSRPRSIHRKPGAMESEKHVATDSHCGCA